MTLPKLPEPPEPEEIRKLRATLGQQKAEAAVPEVPWGPLFHFGATRGSWEDPAPLLQLDALRGWAEQGLGSTWWDSMDRCLAHLGLLPPLPLETKWLRQTPREDSPFVYTGSLYDVFDSTSLEESALRLSRLLRTVESYDYSGELIRDAGAWDLRDRSGVSLRLSHAVTRSAAWSDDDPGERERARAILLRWLGYARGRAPSIPPRPPRGAYAPLPVETLLTTWAGSWGGRAPAEGVSFLVTLGRAQAEVRVMGASLTAALEERWTEWEESAPGERSGPGHGPTREDPLQAADLVWIANSVSPEVANSLGGSAVGGE